MSLLGGSFTEGYIAEYSHRLKNLKNTILFLFLLFTLELVFNISFISAFPTHLRIIHEHTPPPSPSHHSFMYTTSPESAAYPHLRPSPQANTVLFIVLLSLLSPQPLHYLHLSLYILLSAVFLLPTLNYTIPLKPTPSFSYSCLSFYSLLFSSLCIVFLLLTFLYTLLLLTAPSFSSLSSVSHSIRLISCSPASPIPSHSLIS